MHTCVCCREWLRPTLCPITVAFANSPVANGSSVHVSRGRASQLTSELTVIAVDVTVPWCVYMFVCLSRSWVLRKLRWSLFHTTSSCLPDRNKIWLMSANPPSSNFATKWPTPCWIECQRHSMSHVHSWHCWSETQTQLTSVIDQLCGQMVKDSAMVTMESLSSAFPPNGVCTPRPTSRRVLPPGEYDRR